MPKKFKFLLKKKVPQLPRTTGVYTFKNGRLFLYIGKAINIRKRVKNHFQQPVYRDNLFLNKVKKIGFIETYSEIEALLLEAKLIRQYKPKFNILWKDDKNYFYIEITKEDFPRVLLTHQKKDNLKSIYVGPFVEGKSLKAVLKSLRKVFPYRTCKTLLKRPCLWYQLRRCSAPCLLKSKLGKQIPTTEKRIKEESQQNVKNLIRVIQGKKKQVLQNLTKEMKKAVDKENFEQAAKMRDQILALEKIVAHTKIIEYPKIPEYKWNDIQKILQKAINIKGGILHIEAYDVSNIQGKKSTGAMVAFVKGIPDKNLYRKFKIKSVAKPNDVAMIKEVLKRRFSHPEWPYPDLILIDGGKAQLNAAVSSIKYQVSKTKIPVIALAKRKNELYIEGRKKPILLNKLPREIFNLILQLRDEAHRFALKYHLKLRKKALLI